MGPTLLWFRRDLRLADNEALAAAAARGGPVLPVFVLDNAADEAFPPGAAARWWLHHSLSALGNDLKARGSRLILAKGDTVESLGAFARQVGATAVFWNRNHEPASVKLEERLQKELGQTLELKSFASGALFEPGTLLNRQGGPFQVFTPFWRACLEQLEARDMTVSSPVGMTAPAHWPAGVGLDALQLLPRLSWADGFSRVWEPGEAGAAKRLRRFLSEALESYDEGRDQPSIGGTSCLSPHLHFGEITARQIFCELRERSRSSGVFPGSKGEQRYLAELGWREFALQLLSHYPHTPTRPLREKYEDFDWATDPTGKKAEAWRKGRTGFPIIDAGMRQLWQTGWMHNRVRMIVASFWVKQLRFPWQQGAAWFWDTLVDADLANNTLGWQWCTGCGADAAPYFRIFNPVLQGRKFDSDGDYVRRWVPELGKLPSRWIHSPWEASPDVLRSAGIVLGDTYPKPMIDLSKSRKEALDAFARLRQ